MCVYLLGVGVTHFLEVVRAHLINTNFPKWPKLYKVYGTNTATADASAIAAVCLDALCIVLH